MADIAKLEQQAGGMMATCKDCILYDILCEHALQESELKLCNSFKNKADVEEAKRGVWIISCDGYYPYCNQCGYEPQYPINGSDNRTPYCPNCGAKMRKEYEKGETNGAKEN